VVTNLGILKPNEQGEMVLAAIHPGVTYAQAQENTGWPLKIVEDCPETLPPTEEELHILRERLDPQRIYI
jgi:glutaconate CoA-transferase, subunit B